MIEEKQAAPDFSLPGLSEDGEEKVYPLGDFKGQKLVLYFYPRDNTPGCTTEACDFRDNMAKVQSKGAVVLGVSPDSIKSHGKFIEKHGLPFPLLSDTDRSVASAYGAYGEKKMYGKVSMGIIRSTVLIDEEGVIQKLWRGVKVKGHVEEVIDAL
ncbi:MAG: thioredoxin-dependent thiol peroxidase [Thermodesulfobacteriota bacterium]